MDKFKAVLRSVDIYGHQVKLLYKGDDTKKTLPGAFMTVISVGLLLWYLGLQIEDIINNKNQFKQTLIQLDLDNIEFPLGKDNFDTALMVVPPFSDQIQNKTENIYRYMNISAILTITTEKLDKDGDLDVEEFDLELFKCSRNRLFDSTRFKVLTDAYQNVDALCFKQFEMLKLKSDNNRLSYKITGCDQNYLSKKYPGSTCEKNKTKELQTLADTMVIVFSSSNYLDPEEFNKSPIKVNTVQNAFRFSQYFEKVINFEIGFNKAEIHDSKLHENIGSYETDFISTKFVSQGALSNTGGLAGIVFGVIAFIIAPLQEFFYYQSLLKKNFLVEEDQVNKKNKSGYQLGKQKTNDFITTKDDNGQSEKSKFYHKDFKTYLELVKRLRNRVPFRYEFRYAAFYWIKKVICCSKSDKLQAELFDYGKEVIDKQFDIATILRDLRAFKMTNRLLLSKYQRHLIPFFKKHLLNQMYEKNKIKEEKIAQTQKVNHNQKLLNQVTQLMIELFSDNRNPSNSYNEVVLDSLFLQNSESVNKDLKSQLYSAILRYFIQKNLEQPEIINSPSKANGIDVNDIKFTNNFGKSQVTDEQQQQNKNSPFVSRFDSASNDDENQKTPQHKNSHQEPESENSQLINEIDEQADIQNFRHQKETNKKIQSF
ncbi:UNKNOWN [Stylonychia lemnae]|uniref:Transmembrane protein n=1 Tax=Stylonychia lemnae TaxID=5949 RepID=A0A078B802_STYLE|nr:UNKNOWN [Stylonychia lemnae]|eukprot:CDW89387.1 UNKNOWN [Stylonychia lemnae]